LLGTETGHRRTFETEAKRAHPRQARSDDRRSRRLIDARFVEARRAPNSFPSAIFLLRSVVLERTLPVLRCRVHVRQREDSSGVITLTIISLNGAPVSRAASATFDELGGTIGRADTNQLVLEDPDRSVSRVHAQIVFRSGGYAVIDRGSNPIQVNGRDLGNGREAPLAEGDRLQIGGYVLSVQRAVAASSAASDDPVAGLLTPSGGKGPSAPSGARPAAGIPDPLAAFGFDAKSSKGPAASKHAPSPSTPGASIGGIPEDWDPFAPDPVSSVPSAAGRSGAGQRDGLGLDIGGAAPAALIPGLAGSGPGGGDSLDSLFGLKPGAGGDPLAQSALANPAANPNMAASDDPLKSLNMAPKASAATIADDFSDLHLPFVAPPSIDTRKPVVPVAPAVVAPPVAAPPDRPLAAAVMSWDDPGSDGRTVIRPSPRSAEPPAPPAMAPAGPIESARRPAAVPPPAVERPSAPKASLAPTGIAEPGALLAAFQDGLATPSVQIDALTPELMRLVGQLVHEAAKGTVELLVARAALKREVRAEATMIVARENNPLKFSPSAEAALKHLLAPPTHGFMAAAPAMRDAYDDLRAHQFGFIAGMRAALEGVLERFDPAVLEGRLTERSMLESLLPSTRKARMWEMFVEHYQQISNEAADDFHTLFGKAFLKAYEEHIDQLQGSPR
jgi:FHA domain-containing protein